jgi:hypothetical protein
VSAIQKKGEPSAWAKNLLFSDNLIGPWTWENPEKRIPKNKKINTIFFMMEFTKQKTKKKQPFRTALKFLVGRSACSDF